MMERSFKLVLIQSYRLYIGDSLRRVTCYTVYKEVKNMEELKTHFKANSEQEVIMKAREEAISNGYREFRIRTNKGKRVWKAVLIVDKNEFEIDPIHKIK